MCTVALVGLQDGTLLCGMNRDERPSRLSGTPPTVQQHASGSALWPTDRDAGGTWVAVSDRGLVSFLLNRYQDSLTWQPERPLSRGALIPGLLDALDLAEVDRRLASDAVVPLNRLRPFTLVAAYAPDAPRDDAQTKVAGCVPAIAPIDARAWTWDGRTLLRTRSAAPWLWTSSGFDREAAHGARLATWLPASEAIRTAGSPASADELLRAYFASHLPSRGPLSPCMHRPEAATVSHTRIRINADSVTMCYTAGPPCSRVDGGALQLRRRHRVSPSSSQGAAH